MKIVAIIPIKKNSKRVKGKNFKIVNKRPLFHFILSKVKKCNFDEVYVDSDSKVIKNYCKKNNINFIKRKPELAKDNANGNDLINHHRKIINADIYFQIFVTSPLMGVETINNCIKKLKNDKKIDSILTVIPVQTWFWFKNKPVNYNPKILPRSQDVAPMIQETTGLYGIKREALIKYKARIGKKPYFYHVRDEEAVDLDNKKDFEYLEYYVRQNLRSTKR